MREITSATNPFIKHLRALVSDKKTRKESHCFVIEGWRALNSLLCHESQQYTLETLVLTPAWVDDLRLPNTIDTVLLPDHLFDKISDVRNAQGILGIVRHAPPKRILPESGNLLLLDNLRDPGNLGTLIRSAVGAGFRGILLYGDCVDPFNPKVIRSTMGTFAFCNMWTVTRKDIEQLRSIGFTLCITTGMGGENLYEAQLDNTNILVIGSEAHGVSEDLMQSAERKLTIPLTPQCESLNAAIAGSICMFQLAQKGCDSAARTL